MQKVLNGMIARMSAAIASALSYACRLVTIPASILQEISNEVVHCLENGLLTLSALLNQRELSDIANPIFLLVLNEENMLSLLGRKDKSYIRVSARIVNLICLPNSPFHSSFNLFAREISTFIVHMRLLVPILLFNIDSIQILTLLSIFT